MEEIRFISESTQIQDIPEGSGRLFTIFDDEKVLADLISKVGMTPILGHGIVIPEGNSTFQITPDLRFIIANMKGPNRVIADFKESKH